jgi:hypothetical protein
MFVMITKANLRKQLPQLKAAGDLVTILGLKQERTQLLVALS